MVVSNASSLFGVRWQVCAGLRDVRVRIESVKNTQKITDAMKLVAAAKVRRAQEAVVNGRPFSENLVKVSRSRAFCSKKTHKFAELSPHIGVSSD